MTSHSTIYTKRGDTGNTDNMSGERMSKSDSRSVAIGTLDELSASLNSFIMEIDNRVFMNFIISFAIATSAWFAAVFYSLLVPSYQGVVLAVWICIMGPIGISLYNRYLRPIEHDWSEMQERVNHILIDIHHMESCLSVGQVAIDTRENKKDLNMSEKQVKLLEKYIDDYDAQLLPLRNFILRYNSRTATSVNVSRAICRRAERAIVDFSRQNEGMVSPVLLSYINRLSDLLFVMGRYCESLEHYIESDQVCVSKRDYHNIIMENEEENEEDNEEDNGEDSQDEEDNEEDSQDEEDNEGGSQDKENISNEGDETTPEGEENTNTSNNSDDKENSSIKEE